MQLKVVVETPEEFNKWFAAQPTLGKLVAEEKANATKPAIDVVVPENKANELEVVVDTTSVIAQVIK